MIHDPPVDAVLIVLDSIFTSFTGLRGGNMPVTAAKELDRALDHLVHPRDDAGYITDNNRGEVRLVRFLVRNGLYGNDAEIIVNHNVRRLNLLIVCSGLAPPDRRTAVYLPVLSALAVYITKYLGKEPRIALTRLNDRACSLLAWMLPDAERLALCQNIPPDSNLGFHVTPVVKITWFDDILF